jgi:hypothetical protein
MTAASGSKMSTYVHNMQGKEDLRADVRKDRLTSVKLVIANVLRSE